MDPLTILTLTSLAVASIGGTVSALVSWQTWKDMRQIKKELKARSGSPEKPGKWVSVSPGLRYWETE